MRYCRKSKLSLAPHDSRDASELGKVVGYCQLVGSGSLEKDSPLEIIAMKEVQETGFVHDLGLGKGQRHAHKTGQWLAQRIIPALDMGGFSRLFAHGCMLLLRDNRGRDFQKVSEAMA